MAHCQVSSGDWDDNQHLSLPDVCLMLAAAACLQSCGTASEGSIAHQVVCPIGCCCLLPAPAGCGLVEELPAACWQPEWRPARPPVGPDHWWTVEAALPGRGQHGAGVQQPKASSTSQSEVWRAAPPERVCGTANPGQLPVSCMSGIDRVNRQKCDRTTDQKLVSPEESAHQHSCSWPFQPHQHSTGSPATHFHPAMLRSHHHSLVCRVAGGSLSLKQVCRSIHCMCQSQLGWYCTWWHRGACKHQLHQ